MFIEKHHLNDLEQSHIIAEFERAYNVILKVKVCEILHIFDLQDDYAVPTCMQRHTKCNCMIIFRYLVQEVDGWHVQENPINKCVS